MSSDQLLVRGCGLWVVVNEVGEGVVSKRVGLKDWTVHQRWQWSGKRIRSLQLFTVATEKQWTADNWPFKKGSTSITGQSQAQSSTAASGNMLLNNSVSGVEVKRIRERLWLGPRGRQYKLVLFLLSLFPIVLRAVFGNLYLLPCVTAGPLLCFSESSHCSAGFWRMISKGKQLSRPT